MKFIYDNTNCEALCQDLQDGLVQKKYTIQ